MQDFHFPQTQVVVLAAGKGKRMRSATPKVLHPVLGKSMLEHVLQCVEVLTPQGIVVVTGHEGEQVRTAIGNPANLAWVEQEQQLGTGHAVLQAEGECAKAENVLIVCGDTPLLQPESLAMLLEAHQQGGFDVSFLSAMPGDATGYGRVVRDASGQVDRIVEERDASVEQKHINEVSSGIFCVRSPLLFELLKKTDNRNDQQEYYLPDVVTLARAEGLKVNAVVMKDADEMLGVNDRAQLSAVESIMQRWIMVDWQMQGVTIEQPESVRIEASVHIGIDTVIRAGCQLLGSTHIGDECEIGPYAVIRDAWLDDDTRVHPFSHIEEAHAGSRTQIGPFARLRPQAKLDEDVRIGNFVEIKKAVIGRGSKVNHLSYIGDTVMGSECNIGAGTITCNYDGANKHQTTIGNQVFVGSDTKLVAPVSVEDGATIGAGSIITKPVKRDGLTLSARPEQRHVPDWQRPKKKD
jgi:bifunctional UDP-N-acetylglucosamine pyrophosphorylase/glucosamine-1-phosphate N-acetyltransferase